MPWNIWCRTISERISRFFFFFYLSQTGTSGSFKVSNSDVLELRSQKLKTRSFSFLNNLDYGTLNVKKQNSQKRNYKIQLCQDLVDKQRNRVHIKFKFRHCRNSHRFCSRGSPGGWIFFFTKHVNKYQRKIH